jgi:hypothetical protein
MRNGSGLKEVVVRIPESFHEAFSLIGKTTQNEYAMFYNYSVTHTVTNNIGLDPNKVDLDRDNAIIIDIHEDFAFPKQTSSVGVFYIDESENQNIMENYNGAIHRHPKGVRTFSNHDYKVVNTAFQLSLIGIPEENYYYGELSLKLEGFPFAIPVKVTRFEISKETEKTVYFNGTWLLESEFNQEVSDRLKPIVLHVNPVVHANGVDGSKKSAFLGKVKRGRVAASDPNYYFEPYDDAELSLLEQSKNLK